MFEQSILLPDPTKKGWTFAASIAAEVAGVSVLLLIPLIYTEQLGQGWVQSMQITPPVAAPPVVRQVLRPTYTRRVIRESWNLLIPSAHPRTVVELLNDPPDSISAENCPTCVVGATPQSFTSAINLSGTGVPPPPPPKPQPKVEVKKAVDPPPTAPITVSKGTQEAKIIRRVIPLYPSLARTARVQGTVRLQGVISTDGRIERLQVISGHPLLVQAAVEAVKQWLYRPTLLNGQPVEVMAPIDVNFILSN